MMWPRIDAKMYFPRLVTSTTMSFISTILLPTRNMMPTGTYLEHKHRVCVRKGGEAGARERGSIGDSSYGM